MKKLINDVRDVVPEALAGLARLTPGLALIPEYQTAVRADIATLIARGEVTLLSGGGAGHEPAHAGYVGPGMLSAAVSGDVFTSPSTDAVLAGIRAIASPGGVLLIVKNYTGDRLNFGLAAELARAEGIAVEMVVVADDVALDQNGDHAGRRGIAGTVFVHKVAGAAAAAGLPLAAVKAAAEHAITQLGSMGVGLTPCIVPAAGQPGFTLSDDEIELGLGIHGEAGIRRTQLAPAHSLVEQLLDRIASSLALQAGDRVALLVNNLGATPAVELSLVAGDALANLQARGIQVERAWCGTFLTSLEMAGISLSVLRLDDATRDWLDAPTQTAAWPAAHLGRVATTPGVLPGHTPNPPVPDAPSATASATAHPAGQVILAVAQALSDAEPELTRLDQICGDGDLGISLDRGAKAVLSALPGYPLDDLPATLRALSATLRRSLGGTSGPLYAILLLRAAAELEARPGHGPATLARVLGAGAEGVQAVGGAQEGDRTMLDALLPAVRALQAASDTTPDKALAAAADAARQGAADTANRIARRGRASYLGERALGHVDPGAQSVVVWLAALANAV